MTDTTFKLPYNIGLKHLIPNNITTRSSGDEELLGVVIGTFCCDALRDSDFVNSSALDDDFQETTDLKPTAIFIDGVASELKDLVNLQNSTLPFIAIPPSKFLSSTCLTLYNMYNSQRVMRTGLAFEESLLEDQVDELYPKQLLVTTLPAYLVRGLRVETQVFGSSEEIVIVVENTGSAFHVLTANGMVALATFLNTSVVLRTERIPFIQYEEE